MRVYASAEVSEAVSSATIHLANQIAKEVQDAPNVHGDFFVECAIDSVIGWPVIDRVLRERGVSADVRDDLLGLISRANHYAGVRGWDRGYGAGWDAALEVWGLQK